MARTIPHRELRNNSAAVLRAVQDGETFEITNHGEVVAVLSPPKKTMQPLRVRRARTKRDFGSLPLHRVDRPSREVLDELRADR